MKALTRSQEKTLVGIPMNQPCKRFFLIGTWAFYIVFTAQYCRQQDKQLKVAADDVEEDIANQLVKEAEVPGCQGGRACDVKKNVFFEISRLGQLTFQGLSRHTVAIYHDHVIVKGTQLTIRMKYAALRWLQLHMTDAT